LDVKARTSPLSLSLFISLFFSLLSLSFFVYTTPAIKLILPYFHLPFSFAFLCVENTVRVKCLPSDTVGDLKKLIAAQTGTIASKIQLKKWYVTCIPTLLPFTCLDL
jgi:hypothetical protein